MGQMRLSDLKRAANAIGCTVDDVRSYLERGHLWCSKCHTWKDRRYFTGYTPIRGHCLPCRRKEWGKLRGKAPGGRSWQLRVPPSGYTVAQVTWKNGEHGTVIKRHGTEVLRLIGEGRYREGVGVAWRHRDAHPDDTIADDPELRRHFEQVAEVERRAAEFAELEVRAARRAAELGRPKPKPKPKRKRKHVSVRATTYARLREWSARTGISITALVRGLLEERGFGA